MSRIGKKPISIPDTVKITIAGQKVTADGPQGKLSITVNPRTTVALKGKEIVVSRSSDEPTDRSLHGMERSRLGNMVEGVIKGFSRQLILVGVGYRAQISGSKIVLTLGFSHPVEFALPEGIKVKIEKQTAITFTGVDKEMLGLTAARLRSLRPPEPYKGKGIKYADEHILRKAGKAAVAGGKK